MENKVNLKVMHVGCPYLPYQGGSTKRLSNLAKEIYLRSGYEQYLITPSLSDNDNKDNLYFHDVLRCSSINKIGYSNSVIGFINKISPEVVVIHNSRALLNWFLFYAWKFKKVKTIVEIHSFREDSKVKKFMNRILYLKADSIVHLSEASKDYMREEYLTKNDHVIYNGIDLSIKVHTQKKYNPDTIRLCYVGSFHDWQGINIVCSNVLNMGADYWKKNEIYLIGDGPELANVKKKLASFIAQGAKIYIAGWQGADYIDKVIEDTDFLLAVRPSTLATETVFPLKIVDSVNYNVPLICTNVGGLKELLFEKESAYFIDKNDLTSLSTFLSNLPSEDCYYKRKANLLDLRESLGSWKDSAQKYINLFHHVINGE